MLEGDLYYKGGICLLKGSENLFDEDTDKTVSPVYGMCKYGENFPIDGNCLKCGTYKELTTVEIENRLGKKPNNL
jgi:hypothetical protein